jgi:amino acid transporter
MSIELQNWIVLWVIIPVTIIALICISRLAVHTQQKLAAMNEKDPVIDAFVWIYRHTSRRPR